VAPPSSIWPIVPPGMMVGAVYRRSKSVAPDRTGRLSPPRQLPQPAGHAPLCSAPGPIQSSRARFLNSPRISRPTGAIPSFACTAFSRR
jgi:hypothetical protein